MSIRLALVCVPLFVVSLLVVLAIFRAHGNKPVHRCFLAAGVCVLLWQLNCILEFLVWDEVLLLYVYNLNIALAAFVVLGFLMLTINFYGLGEYVSAGVLGLILVLPSVTLLLALFGDPFSLLSRELEILSTSSVYEVHWVPGTWYWAHTGYCILLQALGIYHGLTQHLRLPRSFRECSSMMLAAQIVVTGTVVISFFLPARGTALVLIVVGTCCAMVALYVAMINNDRMNYLYMARTHILDQLNASIFILDNDRNIIEANQAARESLEVWTGKKDTDSLDAILRHLQEMGAIFEDAVEGEKGVDVTISTDSVSRVYNVWEDILPDKTGRVLGSFVSCEDVTNNRRLIRWLERTSGTDTLTGLANRSSLALKQAEYESDEALPLSVIVGDVNGLKLVNDTLGHQYGDQLLVAVAQALSENIPPEGTAFRIGGDEFVIILPNTGSEGAAEVQEAVRQALEEVEVGSLRPSIALGCATRTVQSLSMDEVMHQADQNMYRVKRNKRS